MPPACPPAQTIDAEVGWIEDPGPRLRPGPVRLAAAGHQVTGVDQSANSFAYARQQDPQTATCSGDYRQLPLTETFDAVLLVYLDLGTFSLPAVRRRRHTYLDEHIAVTADELRVFRV